MNKKTVPNKKVSKLFVIIIIQNEYKIVDPTNVRAKILTYTSSQRHFFTLYKAFNIVLNKPWLTWVFFIANSDKYVLYLVHNSYRS